MDAPTKSFKILLICWKLYKRLWSYVYMFKTKIEFWILLFPFPHLLSVLHLTC